MIVAPTTITRGSMIQIERCVYSISIKQCIKPTNNSLAV